MTLGKRGKITTKHEGNRGGETFTGGKTELLTWHSELTTVVKKKEKKSEKERTRESDAEILIERCKKRQRKKTRSR